MKITSALLWLSLLVAVSSENSTDTAKAAAAAVPNTKNFNVDKLMFTLKQLLATVNNNKRLIEDLAEKVCGSDSGSNAGLLSAINMLQMSVAANQVTTVGKIDDLNTLITSINSAITGLENTAEGNQQITDTALVTLTETITSYKDTLSGLLTTLQMSVDANQIATVKKIDDLNTLIVNIGGSITQLETLVKDNQKKTEEKFTTLTSTVTTDQNMLVVLINGLRNTINDNQLKIEGFFGTLQGQITTFSGNIGSQITILQTAVLGQLSTIGNNVMGLQTTLVSIVNSLSNVVAAFDAFVITSCNTPFSSGVYKLKNPSTKVYCDMETAPGGWLVIQQRVDLTFNFNRGWTEYRNGFGDVGNRENYWLGLENLYQLTKSGQWELYIEFKDNKNTKPFTYSTFAVGAEAEKYKLTLIPMTEFERPPFSANNGGSFSTPDNNSMGKCALNSGWWFPIRGGCGNSDLNSVVPVWNNVPITFSRMMIRKK